MPEIRSFSDSILPRFWHHFGSILRYISSKNWHFSLQWGLRAVGGWLFLDFGRFLVDLGSILPPFWMKFLVIFVPCIRFGNACFVLPLVDHHGFFVHPLALHNALIAAWNPYWVSLGLFVHPLQRGGTCAAHGMEPSWPKMSSRGFPAAPFLPS